MIKTVEMRIEKAGRIELFNCSHVEIFPKKLYVLETERGGYTYGQMVGCPKILEKIDAARSVKKVIRAFTEKDLEQLQVNELESAIARQDIAQKISGHQLPMRLAEVEYSLDRSKLTCYFTSDTRVDFRQFVKELAAQFKARIELRQIGVRDEAKILGGVGRCGRELCCSSYIKEMHPISMQMAKTQRLSFNPAKVSGVCGRLMCCLAYEYQGYKQLVAKLPAEKSWVQVNQRKARVLALNILKQKITVEYEDTGASEEVELYQIEKIISKRSETMKATTV